ncbi:MAG: condensation domain-containing protein, partial [Bacteroidota bacterium]
MNEIANMIADLRSKGVQLSEDDGKLLCKAPKGVIDEGIKQFIVDNKPLLLKFLAEENDLRLIKVKDKPARIPLSYEQERLWFLAELGQSNQYHVPGFVNINTGADINLVRKVFDYITQRHDALRSCFRKGENGPYQLILEKLDIPISVVKLHGKSMHDPEVTKAASEFVMQPFDLENGPLIKVQIMELSENKFVLGYCLHHIISDGWSITVMQKELTAAFNSLHRGETPKLPPMEVQFSDFVIWQRKVLSEEKMAEKIKHWKDHLLGYEDLNMPLDFPRPEFLSGDGDREMFTVNSAKCNWIRQYCKDRNVTLFSLLLALVYVLVNKYSRQTDICVGMPIANRNQKEIENMIGFFANTIINRMQLSNDTTLEELIMLSQKELIRGQDYQDVPFSKVVDAVKPARDASKTPIFQIMANYLNFNYQQTSISSDRSGSVEYEYNSSKFDLNFTFSEEVDDELVVCIEYSTDLFKTATISRMLKHYELLIENLIREPSMKLGDIVLETGPEKRMIDSFNENNSNSWKPSLLHSKLKSAEIKYPERIAVVDEKQQITYQQLIDQGNHLAGLINKSGSHKRIGICMDRSCEMIIAILAVLKTGAAYFTIDPEYPEERVKHMLEDSQLNCLVTNSQYAGRSQFGSIDQIVEINGLFAGVEGSPEVSNEDIRPDSAAYIIYTSGSTGKPKGVVQTHQTIDNIAYFQQELWENNSSEQRNIGQFAAASFDVSVQETFFALINHHTLHITPAAIKGSPRDYLDFLSEKKLNYIFLPTASHSYFFQSSQGNLRINCFTTEYIQVGG